MNTIYRNILEKILKQGNKIDRELPIVSLYNYYLNLSSKNLDEMLEDISPIRKEKFKKEFELFLEGIDDVKIYNDNNIKYWNYIGDKFINSYPHYYKNFDKLKMKDNSKNDVLFLGNNEYTNQRPCMSLIHFQNTNGKLYMSMYQRSCDANLGFLADLYHLKLFSEKLNNPLIEVGILYGNLHIYQNNIKETKRMLDEDGKNTPYKFIQNNLKR